MTTSFPSPPIKPLQRLHVYDSLMMNAQRWLLAHEYHRQRQNVHYQAVNQPGIVCGLGVTLSDPPESTASQFRDRRWVKIQPGIAIDVAGNVIVVDEAVNRYCRIAAKPPATGTLTVYVVVSYVEPNIPGSHPHPEVVQEQFRIDQKTHPPDDHEIELCRIQLSADFVQLDAPKDVLFPDLNQLDLNHRLLAQAKPIATVQAAQVKPSVTLPGALTPGHALKYLAQATPALYPAMQVLAADAVVPLQAAAIAPYDLLILDAAHGHTLSASEQDALDQHLANGGVLVIESQEYGVFDGMTLPPMLGRSLQHWYLLPKEHPLRSQPFLFAAPPDIDQSFLQVWSGEGVVVVEGGLSVAWAPDSQQRHTRNDLRTAQEFGINLLHFAHRRRQLTQLLRSPVA